MANVLLDFGKILLQKAIFEGHGKTSLRQALDKFKEALRLTPVSSGEKERETKLVDLCLVVCINVVLSCLVVCNVVFCVFAVVFCLLLVFNCWIVFSLFVMLLLLYFVV